MIQHDKPAPTIGIVGGRGKMGAWFGRVFEASGHTVLLSDLDWGVDRITLLAQSSIVIVSVPIQNTAQLIEEISPQLRGDQLIADLCSIKTAAVHALGTAPGEALSIHPMFGPHTASLENQTLVICPVREGPLASYLQSFFTNQRARIKLCDAAAHDRMMAVIQGLTHFSSITMAHCLMKLGIDIRESLEFTSPIYKLRMDMIGRIMAQDPALYAEIEIMNGCCAGFIEELERSAGELLDCIKRRDLTAFSAYFEKAAEHLGTFKEDALRRSNAILDKIS